MFSTFLLPKLELALRYITGPQVKQWISQYDAALVGSIKHAVASPLSLSHSAVALTAGFLLPSWLEVAVKVSELFIRLNTVDTNDRWSDFGRMLMLSRVGSVISKRNLVTERQRSGSRFQRAAAHAINQLQWKMVLREEAARARGVAARKQHLFARSASWASLLWAQIECSSVQPSHSHCGSISSSRMTAGQAGVLAAQPPQHGARLHRRLV